MPINNELDNKKEDNVNNINDQKKEVLKKFKLFDYSVYDDYDEMYIPTNNREYPDWDFGERKLRLESEKRK